MAAVRGAKSMQTRGCATARLAAGASTVAPVSAAAGGLTSRAATGGARLAPARPARAARAGRAQGARLSRALARAEVGDTLEEFLVKATPDPKLRSLMTGMGEAIR